MIQNSCLWRENFNNWKWNLIGRTDKLKFETMKLFNCLLQGLNKYSKVKCKLKYSLQMKQNSRNTALCTHVMNLT